MVTIQDWKIVSVHGGGVCLFGKVDNIERQTTNIVSAQSDSIKTKSGTVYVLGKKLVGTWEIQLNMKRPSEYANLQKHGLVN